MAEWCVVEGAAPGLDFSGPWMPKAVRRTSIGGPAPAHSPRAWASLAGGVVEDSAAIPPAIAAVQSYPAELFRLQSLALERAPWGPGALAARPAATPIDLAEPQPAWRADGRGVALLGPSIGAPGALPRSWKASSSGAGITWSSCGSTAQPRFQRPPCSRRGGAGFPPTTSCNSIAVAGSASRRGRSICGWHPTGSAQRRATSPCVRACGR